MGWITGSGPLVGRGGELAILDDALSMARHGRGGTVMVDGEAGIGKTRLTEELRDHAADEGFGVAAASSYESDWTPPFALWEQAVSQLDRDVVAAQPDDRLRVLRDVMPSMRDLASVALPAPIAPNEARFRATDAIAHLLLDVARQRPLLVVLDDLHWAEASSLEVLAYLARFLSASRLIIVGTYRGAEAGLEHPLARALAELDRQGACARVPLGPLDDDTARALVERLGGSLPSALVEEIAREATGHPFFITEVVREILAENRRPAHVADMAVPQSVRHAVARRIAHLTPASRRLLAVAAAFTKPFEVPILTAMTGLREEELLAALDESARAQLVRSLGGDRYEFSHALVRRSLYDEVGPSRRIRLHRRIAQALERVYQDGAGEHAGELAAQYHASASLPGAEHGIRYALQAAEQAVAAHAPEQAVAVLRMAEELASDASAEVARDVACRLAVAQAEAFLPEEAASSTERAAALLASTGADGEAVANFALAVARPLFEGRMQASQLAAVAGSEAFVSGLVALGLAALGDRRNLTWARFRLLERPKASDDAGPVHSGRWLGFDPEAVAIARTIGDEGDYAATFVGQDFRSRAELRELLELAEGWTSPGAKMRAYGVVAFGLLIYHGALRETVDVASRHLAYSEAVGSLADQLDAVSSRAFARERLGDFDAAAADANRSDELLSRRTLGASERELPAFSAAERVRRLQRVDWAKMGRFYRDSALDTRGSPSLQGLFDAALAAEAFAHAGEGDEARRILGWVLPAILASEPRRVYHNGAVAFAGGAIWELDWRPPAEAIRDAAISVIEAGVGDCWWTSNELTVARMASVTGELRDAEEWFGRARAALDASGQRPLRAIAEYDEARHRQRHRLPASRALLVEARRRFEALGMSQWVELTDALIDKGKSYPDGLTAREVEVLRLLATGLTNAQIADHYVISVHTVERHLANAYLKIGVHNRAQAAAYVQRASL